MQGNQILTCRNFWLTCLIELCNTKTLLGDLPPKALRKCNWFAKENNATLCSRCDKLPFHWYEDENQPPGDRPDHEDRVATITQAFQEASPYNEPPAAHEIQAVIALITGLKATRRGYEQARSGWPDPFTYLRNRANTARSS